MKICQFSLTEPAHFAHLQSAIDLKEDLITSQVFEAQAALEVTRRFQERLDLDKLLGQREWNRSLFAAKKKTIATASNQIASASDGLQFHPFAPTIC